MRAKLILMLMLAGLGAWAQSPQDRVVIDAWRYVRRGADTYTYPTGLVAYWSMDSVSGTTVFDTFGSNDGTAVGTPLFDSAYGKYLKGVNLNGSSQYIDCGLRTWGIATGFTFSAWIKTTTAATSSIIGIDDSNAPVNRVIQFRVSSGKLSVLRFGVSNNVLDNYSGATTINNGNWYLCTYTFDSSVGSRIYVNGTEDGSGASTDNNNDGGENTLIGARNDEVFADKFNGFIDEVAIWNRALSSTEVSEIYNNGAGRFYTP